MTVRALNRDNGRWLLEVNEWMDPKMIRLSLGWIEGFVLTEREYDIWTVVEV